jgi:seryl-tRNA synthetase
LVLSPAACYPTYPLVAARGPLPSAGLLFDVEATCFRREPSTALSRLQSFRMREFVRIGTPAQITTFRDEWMARGTVFASQLGLPGELAVASDPFFGRVGQIMAVAQRQDALKFELLIPFHPGATPTACMSFNYHKEHFGEAWGIRGASGEVAHTTCVAFGMDRLAVALFCTHGTAVAKWPDGVRRTLGW